MADGFYEWQEVDGSKQPWRITLASDEPFGFAGLWESWKSPEGAIIESTTIITTDANSALHPIHHRMPVIIDPKDHGDWLGRDVPVDRLHELLRPYPNELVRAYRVSKTVNNVRNDGPECIAELAA